MRLKIIQQISNVTEDNKLLFTTSSTGPECNPLVPENLRALKHTLEKLVYEHVTIPQEYTDKFNKLVAVERQAIEDRRELITELQELMAPQLQKFLDDFPSLYPEELVWNGKT